MRTLKASQPLTGLLLQERPCLVQVYSVHLQAFTALTRLNLMPPKVLALKDPTVLTVTLDARLTFQVTLAFTVIIASHMLDTKWIFLENLYKTWAARQMLLACILLS